MNSFVLIPITGYEGVVAFAKVDAQDAERIGQFSWNLQHGYAKRTSKRLGMHREVMCNWDMSFDIDHINGDKLDNRRSNLRSATRSQNRQNTPKPFRKDGHSSKYLGVCKKNNLWYVQLSVNWKKIHGGYFRDETEAAQRYDELAQRYHGSHARLNFAREGGGLST